MAADVPTAERTPNLIASPRAIRLIRGIVFFATGVAVAFSRELHADLAFDIAIAAISLAAIGASLVLEWIGKRQQPGSLTKLLLAACAVSAAAVLAFTGNTLGFALTIATWALVSALLEFLGATSNENRGATFLGPLGILFAILVLLVRDDQIAVLGFFGIYAFVAGVFLGIQAFDSPQPRSPVESTR